jgi:hypothetical protein
MLEKQISVKIKENSYTVKYPSVGQFLDIESRKAELANGQYLNMIKSGTNLSFDALECIDAIANLEVLLPKLKEHLKVNSILEIDAIDFKELRSIFRLQLIPFLKAWSDEFNKATDEK